ncbi:hypothetical protein L4Z64_001279 [Pseudomonas aeruginosa]|uniref:hypothetical protein n=1 Tax=Pseudomonas aeruginosa TaxID=287 RepID=UPI0027F378D7|nr:hypothetical protein [Pseudomonas aeruginosa]EKY4113579.1 hypothetical protein [Pseudomonas aeruginosa]ELJ2276101.1 hypothetical protein [Pseudomonas aeruginosa]MBX6653834.1 hypothetical protein [Pseudomonas aeruginosa]MCS8414909.1 hypothetical protein [Pseudomonas aeruginosa]
MGEAKNRGSFQDRVTQSRETKRKEAEALGLEQRSLDDIREELGLAPGTPFHGYVVHRPDRDEFLCHFASAADSSMREWCAGPQLAHRFEHFVDAHALVRNRDEIVVGLFETETQFFVAEVL